MPKSVEGLEDRISRAKIALAALQNCDMDNEVISARFPKLAKLQDENERLKYRCGILEKRLAATSKNEKSQPPTLASLENSENFSLVNHLKNLFGKAIESFYSTFNDLPVVITETTKENFGDYQCNSAMAISQNSTVTVGTGKFLDNFLFVPNSGMIHMHLCDSFLSCLHILGRILNKAGEKTNPRKVAENIVATLGSSELIERVSVEGAGFINIHLKKSEIFRLVGNLLLTGVKAPNLKPKRVVIDFSSPNIAKQMHVGHLRSTIIGESISRLYEFLGFHVVRLNHVGDWGTQFGMLIAHLSDKFPDYAKNMPPIQDLQAFYKESKKRFDEDKDNFKKRAYDCVVQLQSGQPEITLGWKLICEISRKEFQAIYDRLDITLIERGESFYQDRMGKVIEELDKAGLLTEEDGRKLLFVPGKDVPLTVVKSDGGFTYDTSDLATLRHRLLEEKGDIVLYVVDGGQSLHFDLLYAVARMMKWYDPSQTRVEHVQFGVVLGEDKKKFKTRSGETVRLADLLDEGLKRSSAKLIEKEREKMLTEDEVKIAQEAVVYGCIKYADLSHNRCHDYVFSFDRMLDDRGNTAVYLLYAYTRIRSVGRTAGVDRSVLLDFLSKNTLAYSHPKEFRLSKLVLKFYDVIFNVLDTLYIHLLCEYVYELATAFTEFYDVCYCIEKKEGKTTIHYDRLILCEITADVISTCFHILGIRTVEKM